MILLIALVAVFSVSMIACYLAGWDDGKKAGYSDGWSAALSSILRATRGQE